MDVTLKLLQYLCVVNIFWKWRY